MRYHGTVIKISRMAGEGYDWEVVGRIRKGHVIYFGSGSAMTRKQAVASAKAFVDEEIERVKLRKVIP